jgi:hypothetical protein
LKSKIRQSINRAGSLPDAKFISIQVAQDSDYGWSILSRNR